MAGYNNNHLRFGERCRIHIFYRSREGGPETMCEELVYLSLNRLAISYEEPGPSRLPEALYFSNSRARGRVCCEQLVIRQVL